MDIPKTVNAFPNPLASAEVKRTDEFGYAYASAIWTAFGQVNVNSWDRRQRFIINRKYAENMQSVDKYKQRKDMNVAAGTAPDKSYLNLDWSPVGRIATIVDIIVGKMMGQDLKIRCNPLDPESKTEEDNHRKEMFARMFLKPIADELEPITGVPMIDRSQPIPETEEEAELHFELNYKPDAAMAMEQALEYVFMNNDFDEIRRLVIRDLVVIKHAAIYRYYDENNNIKVDYADPADIITPYSKWPDYRGIPYQAIIRQYTVQELAQKTNKFTEEQLFEIAKSYAGQYNNPGWSWGMFSNGGEGYYNSSGGAIGRPYDNFNIQILEFFFLTIDKEVRRSKTRKDGKMFYDVKKEVPVKEEIPEGTQYISKNIQQRYEGSWIIGSKYIYNYGKSKNIEREGSPGAYSPKTELPIVMIAPNIYDGENKSDVERAIVHEDQMNLIHKTAQQFIIMSKPPGVSVDLEAMENMVSGMGKGIDPLEIMKIYQQTGNVLYRSKDAKGDAIMTKPIEQLRGGISEGIMGFYTAYDREYQMLNDCFGFNQAVDGSSPDTKTAVGTSQMAQQATNNALRTLSEAQISLVERCAKRIALMIQDSIAFNNKGFIDAIGKYAVATLQHGSKIAFNEMGIKIELLPDDEEKAYTNGLIQVALQEKTIKASDAIRVRAVLKENPKLAEQLLVVLENKNQKEKMEEQQKLSQENAKSQQESAKVAAQAKAQAEMQIDASKAKLLQLEAELKSKQSAQDHAQKLEEIEKKGEKDKEVAQVNHDGKVAHTAFANVIKPPPQPSLPQ